MSFRKIESEVVRLTRGSEFYPRKVIHMEDNVNSVLLIKKQKKFPDQLRN